LTDVAVVGGGLVGTSVAYELACAGARVTVIDASLPGTASNAGAGIISPLTFTDDDESWSAFGVRAAAHLRALIARVIDDGGDVGPDTFASCGSLVVALAEHEDPWFSEVRQRIMARSSNITDITTSEAKGLFPPLGAIWRALYDSSAARLDGRLLRAALRVAAKRRGVDFLEMEATGIDLEGAHATAVRGRDRSVACDALVLAAGAWCGGPAGWLDCALPVTPTKGQIVHVVLPETDQTRPGSARWPIVQPILNFYLVPWPGGRVACGGTFESEAGFDCRPTAGGLRDLLRECMTIAPGLSSATFHEVRVGLRPMSPDDRPLLGPVPGTTNVHVCSGHGANGLLMGPYSAALVAAGVLGKTPDEISPYAAARFA
jgi:D-amino-acid dehydrogenase